MSRVSAERQSMGEAAYELLRADIVMCRLAPGERVTERAMRERTGFGASPVRDALSRLDHEGLIVTRPRKGYIVSPLTVKGVDDLFDVWRIVGPELLRLGVPKATDEQFARLQALVATSRDPRREHPSVSDEAQRRIGLTIRVFDVLDEAADNAYLTTAYRRVAGDITRVGVLLLQSVLGDEPLFSIDAMLGRDLFVGKLDDQVNSLREYIDELHERTLVVLSRWPSVMSSEVRALS